MHEDEMEIDRHIGIYMKLNILTGPKIYDTVVRNLCSVTDQSFDAGDFELEKQMQSSAKKALQMFNTSLISSVTHQ